MLDGIVVDVINVPAQVRRVTDLVLPEPALPDASFSLVGSRVALDTLATTGGKIPRVKPDLIRAQRSEKSESPSGNLQTQCTWSV